VITSEEQHNEEQDICHAKNVLTIRLGTSQTRDWETYAYWTAPDLPVTMSGNM